MIRDLLLMAKTPDTSMQGVGLNKYESYEAWSKHSEANRENYSCRWRFEQGLLALNTDDVWFGWCVLCEQPGKFLLPSVVSATSTNLREELICAHCGSNARVRAGLQIVKANIDACNAKIYITEQASPTYVWLQRNFKHIVSSEYVKETSKRRRMQQYLSDLGGSGEIRFEDVTKLSFDDASLDVVVSFDVLEHVPNYAKALQEFARTLRAGGMLVLTAPFISNIENTVTRARITDEGGIEHLLPPEYHGDPADEGGILCFYHFGWDLLDAARASGFSQASMALPWMPGMGLMDHLWTLTAIR